MVPLLPCSMTHPIGRRSLRPDRPQLSRTKLMLPGSLLPFRTGVSHQWPPSYTAKGDSHALPSSQYAGPRGPHVWGQRHQKQHLNLNSSPLPGLVLSIPELSGWEGRGGHIVLQILPHLFSPSLLSPRSDTEHSQHSSGSPTFLFIFEVVVTSPGETGPEKLILSQQCEIIRRLLHFPLIEIHMLTRN